MKIGPRYDAKCVVIYSSLGHIILWVNEFRYLGIFIAQSRLCSLDVSKSPFIGLLMQSSEKSAEQRQKRLHSNWF